MRQKPRLTRGTRPTLKGPTVSEKAIGQHDTWVLAVLRRAIFSRAPMRPQCLFEEKEA